MDSNFKFFKNNLDDEARHFLGEDYAKVRLFPVPTENAVDLGYRYADKIELNDSCKEEIVNKLYSMLHEKFPDARSLVYNV